MRKLLFSVVVLGSLLAAAYGSWLWWNPDPGDLSAQQRLIAQLEPLHKKLGPAQDGDWLLSHEEAGQTFREYARSRPVKPQGKRRVLYIQPLGEFTKKQRQLIDSAAEYLGLCYNLPIKVAQGLSLDLIPAEAQRVHPRWGMQQILSTYVLDKVLAPRLPDDAAAYICFTATDLYPADDWNFVFGQASLRNRVGVWSIYRKGDPDESEEAYRLCLLRTLKTAAHETGHMFSIQHCTAYECAMCGSNNLEESDRRPLAMCPECVAKICFATGAQPAERFAKLATFCEEQGLTPQADFFRRSAKAVR